MSITAYRAALRSTEAPRSVERRVLLSNAAGLARHADAYDAATKRERIAILHDGLRTAVADTQALWAALRHDLSDRGNGLPPDLRAALLSLCGWVRTETDAILAGEGAVAPLVEVNRSLADGLRASPAEAMACP